MSEMESWKGVLGMPIAVIFWMLLNFIPWTEAAGGDCMSGNVIDCFECNTWEDERCHDPFNYTINKESMPPLKPCEGCCVKMVQFIGTGEKGNEKGTAYTNQALLLSEHYQIKRTCTDDFGVNFFMVNHACMTEGHRFGHMCFCEEDGCNYGNSILSSSSIRNRLFILTIALLSSSMPSFGIS